MRWDPRPGWVLIWDRSFVGGPRLPGPQFATEDAEVERIFELADQRLAVMPAVAAVKWQTQAPIFDPPRESAVIQRASRPGRAHGPGRRAPETPVRVTGATGARSPDGAARRVEGSRLFVFASPSPPWPPCAPSSMARPPIFCRPSIWQPRCCSGRTSRPATRTLAQQTTANVPVGRMQNRHELLAVLHSVTLTPVPALQRFQRATSCASAQRATTRRSVSKRTARSAEPTSTGRSKLAEQLHARAGVHSHDLVVDVRRSQPWRLRCEHGRSVSHPGS